MALRSLLLLLVLAATAHAQPSPAPPAAPTAPTAPAPTPDIGAPPPQWASWEIQGSLLPEDSPDSLRGVLSDTMETHRALTETAREDIAAALQHIGYQLVRLDAKPTDAGIQAILVLDTIPMVRSVSVRGWSFTAPQFDDEIKRRLRVRPGAYLAYDPATRKQQLIEEQTRVEEFLHDEGYFDARAQIALERVERPGVRVTVEVNLGKRYEVGAIRITGLSPQSPVSADEVRNAFTHEGRICVPRWGCLLGAGFSRAQHQADIATVTRMFQSRGFHAVKVSTDFDPATSFNRRTHAVDFTVHVDERRQVDIGFEGNYSVSESDLKAQLTFDEASSADAYEIAASAAAIQRYYQGRGWFDAMVTTDYQRFRLVDHIVFRIEEGPLREIRRVDFAAVDGDLAIATGDLEKVVSLQASSFFGGGSFVNPTSQALADDAERVRRLYIDNGYGDARVAVRIGPDAAHVGSPAMIGALLAADPDGHDLYVRFDIDQGPRTLVDAIQVVFVGPHRGTCDAALEQLAASIDPGVDDPARRAKTGCGAELTGLAVPTLPDRLDGARSKLKDWFWNLGRPRAEAKLEIAPAAGDPHHSVATYTVTEHGPVRIGKVIVRGNFRTDTGVILDELGFREGAPLTGDLYSAGPRRLRAMNLFSAVNVELLGFDENQKDTVDVVVRVEERNDVFAQVDVEAGYTQVNGDYARVTTTLPNPYHTGTTHVFAVTLPLHWIPPFLYLIHADAKFESVDYTLKVPRWRVRQFPWIGIPADAELQGFLRQQDTPRFGQLKTIGGSFALSRVWNRPHRGDQDARSIAGTLRFDFRDRQRDQDAIRAIGPGSESTQAPIETQTGTVGLTLVYDHRLDAAGNLNPLIPERGFKLEVGGLYATKYLFSQDTFFKINASAQGVWMPNQLQANWLQWLRTDRLQFHADLRLDEGFPLGGPVLLPEVERFFAGGDTTVRGYAEDRLATELIEVGVPPFGGVQQIRVQPAGGNIRLLASADMQVRVWRLAGIPLASAIFVDAGIVTNSWGAVSLSDIRPAVGVSLARWLAPFGAISVDYAIPLRPRLGDNPLGFFAISVALR